MKIKFCCLPGILQKQRKFVASFVYKIDKIPVKGPSFFNLAWETGSQPNSHIFITFSGSDGLNAMRTQAKHFLRPRVLFSHPPPYAACVLNVWAPPFLITNKPHWLFYKSKYRSGRGTGYSTYELQELFFLCKFSLCYLKTLSRSVKAQWCIIVYNKNNIPR